MAILVNVWAGDVHQNHVGSYTSEDWSEVFQFVEAQVEGGMLCNILHTDFKVPPERVAQAEAELLKNLNK